MRVDKNLVLVAACILLSVFSYLNVQAQPTLRKLEYQDISRNVTKLIIFSDKDEIPIQNGICHQMVPETVTQNNVKYVRYHFEDVPEQPQWYKNFPMFKMCQPYNYIENKHALYDINNTSYLSYVKYIDNMQYMELINPLPQKISYYFYVGRNSHIKLSKRTDKDLECTYITIDGINYFYFDNEETEDYKPENTLYYYTFDNADFINDDLPDICLHNDSKYLFLQRDYKLGQSYNTVIFPVDVPINEYNHLYNDGKNKLIVYKLESIGPNSLHFIKDITGVLKADTPYIIKSQTDDETTSKQVVSEYYMTDELQTPYDINTEKNVVEENNDLQIIAQYKESKKYNVESQTDFDVYVISSNKLTNCRNADDITINRFRWYIKRPKNLYAEPMTMTFDGVTEIQTVINDVRTDNGNIYDINGIKCGNSANTDNLKNGCYIINGKVRLISQ